MQSRDVYDELMAKVAAEDPLLVDAVADVDLTLIDAWLRLMPWERAARCFDMADGIAELKTWHRVG